MRNIKHNLWKKLRSTSDKERRRDTDEVEIEKAKTLKEKLLKLEEIKPRLKADEEKRSETYDKDKIIKRKERKRGRGS